MQLSEIIERLSTTQALLNAHLPPNRRPFVVEQSLAHRRGALVIGPRGVGKSTFLLHEAALSNLLYVSVDNPLIAPLSLSELAEAAFAEGYNGIVFDELHHATQWSKHAKSIYDSHPNKLIWISDSSSLVIRRGAADLSRRFPKLFMPLLSFREYIFLKQGLEVAAFDPFKDCKSACLELSKKCNIMGLFKTYKEEGFRPIFLEGDYNQKILAIIEKSIFYDVPFFVPRLTENHLRLMNAIIGYLAGSPIPTININSMATDWNLGKEKLYELLDVLEQVGLIHIIRYKSDFKTSGKGAKIFFTDPSMYSVLSGLTGSVREAFVATMFRHSGKAIYACKDETKGDFFVDNKTIEIGGRTKTSKGADYVLRDDIELPTKNIIPLWCMGMMF